MAFNHIFFNSSLLPYGPMLRRALDLNEQADDQLRDIRDCMVQMIDGDGSQNIHYAELTKRFGFADDAAAHAAFLEIDSAFSKTSADGNVSNVRAARDQLFNKLR